MSDVNDSKSILTVKQRRLLTIKNITKDVLIFVIVFCLVISIFRFIKFPQIAGDSMLPTFHDEERVLAVTTDDIAFGDIVIAWSNSMNEYIIKRVIGLPGDHIRISEGHVYRNGTMLYEGYINEQMWRQSSVERNIIVPDNEIFVMGDNRNFSTDSRMLGTLSIDNVKMKVVTKANWVRKLLMD